MSNQEMAHRLYDILSTKAALGMGRDSEGLLERYGSGKRGPKKGSKEARDRAGRNPWILWIMDYANAHGISYRDALKSKKACVEYRNLGNLSRKRLPCVRNYGSKRSSSKAPKKRATSKRSMSKAPKKRATSKRSMSKAPKKKATSKKCSKGKVLKPVHSYKRRSGRPIKKYYRCVKK